MKALSKVLALILALSLVLGMSAAVWAAGTGSVTVENATVGEVYKIYKVFDLTYSGSGEASTGTEGGDSPYNGVAYTYTKSGSADEFYTALTAAGSPFELTATSSDGVYRVALKTGKTGADIAAFLKANESKLNAITASDKSGIDDADTATATTVKWGGLDFGYYYITSSLGSTVTIDSTLKDVKVKDKNSVPSQDKKQAVGTAAPASAAGYTDADQNAQIGDTIWYQIEVTDGKGTDTAITISDTLSNGLTNKKDVKVYLLKSGESTETEVTAASGTWNFDGEQSDSGFKIVFAAAYVDSLAEGDKLFLRYSAAVNGNAAADSDAKEETNTSKIEYSNQSAEDTVKIITFKFQLDKVQNETYSYADLKGARFELYRGTKSDANKVWFTKGADDSGVPVLIVAGTGATAPVSGAFCDIRLTDHGEDTDPNCLNSSKVIFKGLDKAQYILHETEQPKGYNLADSDTAVAGTQLVAIDGTIVDTAEKIGADDTAVISVINNSGTELPSTGGIGTTIFYVAGAVLVIVAGILLVSGKKADKGE